MGQTFVAINQAAQSGTTILGNLDDKTLSLQSCFSGTSFPGSPVEGQLCYRTDTDILHIYAAAAWHQVLISLSVTTSVEANWQQFKELRVENLGADEATGAGKSGYVFYRTDLGDLRFVDIDVDNVVKKLCNVIPGTSKDVVEIPLSEGWKDASNPPTDAFKGTTPSVRGLLFDAVNELFSLNVRVPTNYSGDGDLSLILACVLNQAETNGDDIDWSADLLSLADGESATAPSTAAAASATDIGTNSADGELIRCTITIDYDDATNPVNPGDRLLVEIHRTDLAEVGGVILVGAALQYPCDEAIHGSVT